MQDKLITNIDELQNTLNDISMKNTSLDFNWAFEVIPVDSHGVGVGWFVNVAFKRPDTNTGEFGIGRGRKEFIQYNTTESSVVKTAWLLIELVIRHELMEAFHWRGKRIFNPHNSVYDLAKIQ